MYKSCDSYIDLTLKRQMQMVASRISHSFAKCAEQSLIIRALIISDGISTLWITLNPSDLRSFLVLILAGVPFENNRPTTSAKEFG